MHLDLITLESFEGNYAMLGLVSVMDSKLHATKEEIDLVNDGAFNEWSCVMGFVFL
jgi:hypothetical protein